MAQVKCKKYFIFFCETTNMTFMISDLLNESDMPTHWSVYSIFEYKSPCFVKVLKRFCCSRYNIQADLPVPMPPVLHPGTLQPVGPADLAPLFPESLIMQEVILE